LKKTTRNRSTNHKVPEISFGVEVGRMRFAGDAQVPPMRDFIEERLGAFKLSEGCSIPDPRREIALPTALN
jgi:hypothetical protein